MKNLRSMALTNVERTELARVQAEMERRETCPFRRYFPDMGPLRRELYPRSLEFFAAGRRHQERGFVAANRTSKTVSAAYEVTAHLTGDYPTWWPGQRLPGPSQWWTAGDTRETTRDIIQVELFGPIEGLNTGEFAGMVPYNLVLDYSRRSGVDDCLDTVWVRHREHVHGAPGVSSLKFKSYDQGRRAFQGTTVDGIWLDEEPPEVTRNTGTTAAPAAGNNDIYTECLLRLATTGGPLIVTFTPLRGLTPFLDEWLETALMSDVDGRIVPSKSVLFEGAT